MRALVLCLLLSRWAAACASTPPPPPEQPAATNIQGDSNNRALSKSECESLGQFIVDACRDRANMDRSTQTESWCSDVGRRVAEGGNWVTDDCLPHIKYVDSVCFRTTTRVRNFMDCDANVDRTAAK